MSGAVDETRMLDGHGDWLLSDLDDVGADCD